MSNMLIGIGGDGVYCVAVLWALTAIVLAFLVARIYTRVVCLAAYGWDDTFYVITVVLTIAYSSVGTVACMHGFGRADLTPEQRADTSYWRMIAQTFSLLATGTSKASVGFFLLRLVVVLWNKVVICLIVAVMGVLSVLGALFTWVGCSPFAFGWDERIEGGTCLNTVPLSMALALGTIGADIIFVVLAWIFIIKLQTPRKEKIILLASLSLGLFAAVAGAIRVMNVKGVRDVPVPVIVWSQVETSVTLICVGIPVCLPLWFLLWHKLTGGTSKKGSSGHDHATSGGIPDGKTPPIGLQTISGNPMPGSNQSSETGRVKQHSGSGNRRGRGRRGQYSLFSTISSTLNRSTAGGTTATNNNRGDVTGDGHSDEVRLTDHQQHQSKGSSGGGDLKHQPSESILEEGGGGAAAADYTKQSWILGAPSQLNSVSVVPPDPSRDDDINSSGGWQRSPGIRTQRTYEVQRS